MSPDAIAFGRRQILVLSQDLPKPDIASGERRLFLTLQLLAKEHDVFFWSPGRSGTENCSAEQYAEDLRAINVTVLPHHAGQFSKISASQIFDVVLCEFWHCAEWAFRQMRCWQPWAHVVVDSVDVHFLREEAGLRQGIGDSATVNANKLREIAVYRQADAVIVVTEEDKISLTNLGGISHLTILPNIILPRPRAEMERPKELLFVGGFGHAPNADGIGWFVSEILPLVKAAIHSVSLTIVGSNAPQTVRAMADLPGVNFVGYVPNTAPYLDCAAVSVAPLRFGAGMKGKVTEAMSAGIPVVTTTIGAQGLNVESGKQLFVADDPKIFAAHITHLLQHPAESHAMGLCGQKHIETICGDKAAIRCLEELLAPVKKVAPFTAPLRLLCGRITNAILRQVKGRKS